MAARVVLCACLALPALGCQKRLGGRGERIPVVILDLQSQGVTQDRAEHFSDLIRATMISTEEFRVIERDTVRRRLALKEMVLAQSGITEELSEIGRNLNARLMVSGTMRRANRQLSIVLNAVDIETLEVVASGVARSDSDAGLEEEIFRLSRRMIARIKGISESDVVISENYARVRDSELASRLLESTREILAVPGAFLEEHKHGINWLLPGFKHAKTGNVLTGLFFLGSFAGAMNTAYIARSRYDRTVHEYNMATLTGAYVLSTTSLFEGQSGDYSTVIPSGRISGDFLVQYLYFSSIVDGKRGEAIRQGRAHNQALWGAAFLYLWAQKRSADNAFFSYYDGPGSSSLSATRVARNDSSSGTEQNLTFFFVEPTLEVHGRPYLRVGLYHAF